MPGQAALSRLADLSRELGPELSFSIHTRLDDVEDEWRRFQQIAECTAFQSFEWLATWQRHIGARDGTVPIIVVGRFADGATAFILPLAVETRRSVRRLCWLGQELGDYNAPLLARDFCAARHARSLPCAVAGAAHAPAIRSRAALRLDRIREDAANGRRPEQSLHQPSRHAERQQCAHHAIGRRLGELLSRQALFGDAPARPHQAQAPVRVRRHSLRNRRRAGRFAANARYVVGAEEAGFLRARAFPTSLRDPAIGSFSPISPPNPNSRHLAHVSRVQIGSTCAAANFAIVFGDCYYHVLSSYCDSELTRYGPGTLHLRELLAYAIKTRLAAVRFHHRRRALQAGMVRPEAEALRLQQGCDMARPDRQCCSRPRGAGTKRFIKQTPVLWHWASRLRSVMGPLLQRVCRPFDNPARR